MSARSGGGGGGDGRERRGVPGKFARTRCAEVEKHSGMGEAAEVP